MQCGLMCEHVDLSSVRVGLRVGRGRDWRSGKWRSDVKDGERCRGTVMGFTDREGNLVGNNTTGRHYDRFYLEPDGKPNVGPGWAAVEWDNGNQSVYPIGSATFLGDWWARKCTGKRSKQEISEWERELARGTECFTLVALGD